MHRNEARIRAEIEKRGLTIVPCGKSSWRVFGPGVDVRVAALEHLDILDLKPAKHPISDRRAVQ